LVFYRINSVIQCVRISRPKSADYIAISTLLLTGLGLQSFGEGAPTYETLLMLRGLADHIPTVAKDVTYLMNYSVRKWTSLPFVIQDIILDYANMHISR